MSEEISRIGLISDTHYWPDCQTRFGDGNQLQPWSESIQQILGEEVETSRLDLLLHLGDYCCGGGVFEMPTDLFYASIEELHQRYSKLATRYYGLPGNHDLPSGHLEYSFSEKVLNLEPRLGRTIDLPQARLIMLNSQGHTTEQIQEALPNDPVYGQVSPAELQRLESDLKGADGRPIILLTHQLLWGASSVEPLAPYYLIRNGDEVISRISAYPNVRAIFGGHAHRYDVQKLEIGGHPRVAVIVPSLIEFPLAWLQLELSEASLEIQLRPIPLQRLPFLEEEMERKRAEPQGRLAASKWHSFSIALR